MELAKDFIETQKLSDDQVTAIQTVTNDNEAILKKGWDTKANDNAEGILTGASDYIKTKTGVKLDREQGEKVGDYINRITDLHFTDQKTALETAKNDYNDKLKNFKGDDALKTKNGELETANDSLLQKLAKLEGLEGLDVKNTELQSRMDEMTLSIAIGQVKPTFADSVNTWEATAKWDTFISNILKEYDIKMVDNEAIAVLKTNIHSQKKLSELVDADAEITALKKGRQQSGPKGTPKDLEDLEGVPFQVPKEATTEDVSKLIRDYLATEGIKQFDSKYAKRFSEMNLKIATERTK